MAAVVQTIRKKFPKSLDKAIRYYSLLSAINGIGLTRKQIELLAFTSVRGTITPMSARQEFIETFGSSFPSLENIKIKLAKLGWLVEIDKMYRVNPQVNLDFHRNIILHISLEDEGV